MNLAARLEQAAAPGEIIMGLQTWALVRDAVTADALAPLRLKGKSQPVAACRLMELRADVDARARPGRAPLVGRASQLRMLADAFTNVARERSCGLFTVAATSDDPRDPRVRDRESLSPAAASSSEGGLACPDPVRLSRRRPRRCRRICQGRLAPAKGCPGVGPERSIGP